MYLQPRINKSIKLNQFNHQSTGRFIAVLAGDVPIVLIGAVHHGGDGDAK
jgi:hypothetical protein